MKVFGERVSIKAGAVVWAVALCIALLAGPGTVLGGEDGLDRKDIAAVIRRQRDSIESYRLRFETTQETLGEAYVERDPLGRSLPFGGYEDATDGYRRRSWSQYGESREQLTDDITATWNGDTCKTYSKTRKQGTVDDSAEDEMFAVRNSPLYFAMYIDSTKDGGRPDYVYDIVAILENDRCVLEPNTEMADGVECIAARMGCHKVWLDPARGFAVVGIDLLNVKAPSKLAYSTRNSDFRECGNGVWLPARTVTTRYLAKAYLPEEWGTPYLEWTYEASIVEVNTDLPDELFDIQFPEGTRVRDRVLNVHYEVGPQEMEKAIDAAVDEILEPQEESGVGEVEQAVQAVGEGEGAEVGTPSEKPPLPDVSAEADGPSEKPPLPDVSAEAEEGGSGLLVWVVAGLAVICAAAGVFVVTRRRRRREAGGEDC